MNQVETTNTLVDGEVENYIRHRFILNRHTKGISTYGETVRILNERNLDVPLWIQSRLNNSTVTRIGDWLTFVQSADLNVTVRVTSNTTRIDIGGDQEVGKQLLETINNELEVVHSNVEWITSKDMDSVSLPLVSPKGITDSSYPFIEGGVDNFVEEFLNSSENVLLLIGPPGTGKSNLIQYIAAQSEGGAMVTYDPDIMAKDMIFANFIESSSSVFIMEDADAFLSGRTDGNLSMHRFLNVSSGIVSMKNKKLIFSTNLENTDEVDSALLRPGRLFSVVQFRPLTKDESNKFLKEHDFGFTVEKEHTLAELYNMNKRNRSIKRRTIGFV